MLRVRARNPILVTVAAAIIVFVAYAAFAGRVRIQPQQQRDVEHVQLSTSEQTYSVVSGSENGVPAGAAVTPKLAVHVPRSASNASAGALPQIAKTGEIELLVSNVDTVTNEITSLAHHEGGDVFSLDAQNATNGRPAQSADATIRVPSTAFDRTMQHLAALGTVRSSSVKAEDLTANITDSDARLRNLRRTESDILKIMDRSGNVEQVMNVETQLSQVREQIETLEADVASMRGRVAYATVDIHVQAEAQRAPAEPSALTRVANAAVVAKHALLNSVVNLLSACIWFTIVYLPYLFALAIAAWMLRLGLRKYAIRR